MAAFLAATHLLLNLLHLLLLHWFVCGGVRSVDHRIRPSFHTEQVSNVVQNVHHSDSRHFIHTAPCIAESFRAPASRLVRAFLESSRSDFFNLFN